ncbi:MAG: phage N-6-adenine-methyltransferase [Actinomycetales bacterium]|nr:phage N-6-adenine-methyltransferase [Actinomycetales bacterium]
MSDVAFSSDRMDWATPWSLFQCLHAEFGFTLDAAASAQNAKCAAFLTEEQNSLDADWLELSAGGRVWLNPPYGRSIGDWIFKCAHEAKRGARIVALVFARTDTQWWNTWATEADEIRFLRGRVTFEGAPNAAPAPSCLLIFDRAYHRPTMSSMETPR